MNVIIFWERLATSFQVSANEYLGFPTPCVARKLSKITPLDVTDRHIYKEKVP